MSKESPSEEQEEVLYDAPKWLLDRPSLAIPLLLLVLGGQVYGANAISESEAVKRLVQLDGKKVLDILEKIDLPVGDYVGRRDRNVCSGEDDGYFSWHSIGALDAMDLQKSFGQHRNEFCNTPKEEAKALSDYIQFLVDKEGLGQHLPEFKRPPS